MSLVQRLVINSLPSKEKKREDHSDKRQNDEPSPLKRVDTRPKLMRRPLTFFGRR
jgi:hypothetical protein